MSAAPSAAPGTGGAVAEPLDQDWTTAVLSSSAAATPVTTSWVAPSAGAAPVQRPLPPAPPRRTSRGPKWAALALGSAVVVGLLLRAAISAVLSTVSGGLVPEPSTSVVYETDEGAIAGVAWERAGGVTDADAAFHAELWADWAAMASPYWARRVETFRVATDPPYAASVSHVDPEADRWALTVNSSSAREDRAYFDQVFVHELAHIITLGDDQATLEPTRDGLVARQASCGGAPIDGGCAASGSVLARFILAFWDADGLAAADAVEAAGNSSDAVVEAYRADPSRFVTAYAASDPVEDLAETIVALAFDQRQRVGSVAAQKVQFVADTPELWALADRVRAVTAKRR